MASSSRTSPPTSWKQGPDVDVNGKSSVRPQKHRLEPTEADAARLPLVKRNRVQDGSMNREEHMQENEPALVETLGTSPRSSTQRTLVDGREKNCKPLSTSSPGKEQCEDLNKVFVVIPHPEDRDEVLAMTALSHFLHEEYMTAGVETQKSTHYSYEKLRTWLRAKAGIPMDASIKIDLDVTGTMIGGMLDPVLSPKDDSDLVSILTLVHLGVVRAHRGDGYAPFPYMVVEPAALPASSAPDTSPAQAKGAGPEGSREHPIDIDGPAYHDEKYEAARRERWRVDGISDERWREVCAFFQLKDPAARQHYLPGMLVSLEDYQLDIVLRDLTNPVTEGVNGGIDALEPGMGKTRLTALVIYIHAWYCITRKEIIQERNDNAPKRHLPSDNCGGVCPSQASALLQCPCVSGTLSKALGDSLANVPSILGLPPPLFRTWMAEMDRMFEKRLLNIKVFLSGQTERSIGAKGTAERQRHLDELKGILITRKDWPSMPAMSQDWCIRKGRGDATMLCVVSHHMLLDFYNEFRGPEGQGRSLFTPGLIVLDEFHNYKGAGGHLTEVFRVIREMQNNSYNPVKLLLLSGTLLQEGPMALKAALEHFGDQWQRFGDGTVRQRLRMRHPNGGAEWTNPGAFEDIKKAFAKMRKDVATPSAKRDELNQNKDTVNRIIGPIARVLVGSQKYRGRVLMPLPDVTRTTVMLTPVMGPKAKEAFGRLIGRVETLVTKKWKEENAQWEKDGRLGEQPSLESVRDGVCSGSKSLNKDSSDFVNLQRSSMFPMLARLLERKVVTSDDLASTDCQKYATSTRSLVVAAGGRRSVGDIMQDSSEEWALFEYFERLWENSAKLIHIKKLIQAMRRDDTAARLPPDGSRVQHAIVFCYTPIAAVLTYLGLLADKGLQGCTEIHFLGSKVKSQDRDQVVAAMNEDVEVGGRNKILVTTTPVGGEGFNLQRVNNVWFTEFPVKLGAFEQAQCRAVRKGQKMEVAVHILQEENNWMETHGWKSLEHSAMVVGLLNGTLTVEDLVRMEN